MSFTETQLKAEIPRLKNFANFLASKNSCIDREDLLQSTLLTAWQKRFLFKPDTNLRSWLFTIMSNIRTNQTRKYFTQNRHNIAGSQTLEAISKIIAGPDNPLISIYIRDLKRALNNLPSAQRNAVVAAAFGFQYQQIAQFENIITNTARSRISRGRETLRQQLT